MSTTLLAIAFSLLLVVAAAQNATNWAVASLGASASANNAGYYSGYTAEPAYAIDEEETSFWSSTGGATCCTESAPAWLLVSLGALRPVAALQLLYVHDMSFTLALGNASGGPWVTVATRGCAVCQQNVEAPFLEQQTTAVLPAAVAASYALLTVTWSSAGGVGGCDNLCDFATDVFTFGVWGPGVLPAAAVRPQPTIPPPSLCASTGRELEAYGEAALLTGDAALSAPGGGYDGRSRRTQLTAAQSPGSAGAAEFAAIIRPDDDCACDGDSAPAWGSHGVLFTVWTWIGGGVMPGEGLVISFVDASKQTPGKTVYMPGCGVAPALPAHAFSIVFDTASSDPACDAPGTGVRLVSTLAGVDAPPLVMRSTLELGTTAFRQAGWVAIQVSVKAFDDRRDTGQPVPHVLMPQLVWVNGSVSVSALGTFDLSGFTLDALYMVVSARTGTGGGDAHSISGVRAVCYASRTPGAADDLLINWEGLRQPYTPPRSSARPPPPPPPKPVDKTIRRGGLSPSSALAFACAFAITVAAMAAAGAAWRCSRRAVRRWADFDVSLLETSKEADQDGDYVFLLCSSEDVGLADAVHAKLRLAGLCVRVAALAAEGSAGLDADVLRALRAASIFVPLVTLPLLQRVARAAAAAQPDAALAAWLAALHGRDGAAASGAARRLHTIRPLLVGSVLPAAWPPQWGNLLLEPAYTHLLATLPDTVPAASAAALDAALRRAGAAPLPARFAALTVRDIVLGPRAARGSATGDAAPALATGGGILDGSGAPLFALACAMDDLGLYLRDRFVKLLREDLLRGAV